MKGSCQLWLERSHPLEQRYYRAVAKVTARPNGNTRPTQPPAGGAGDTYGIGHWINHPGDGRKGLLLCYVTPMSMNVILPHFLQHTQDSSPVQGADHTFILHRTSVLDGSVITDTLYTPALFQTHQ